MTCITRMAPVGHRSGKRRVPLRCSSPAGPTVDVGNEKGVTVDETSVRVLGADWCSDCRRSKRLLERLGVRFSWVDLEAEPEHVSEVLRRNDGLQSIPVVIFPDDSHLTEPSDAALTERLTALGLLPV